MLLDTFPVNLIDLIKLYSMQVKNVLIKSVSALEYCQKKKSKNTHPRPQNLTFSYSKKSVFRRRQSRGVALVFEDVRTIRIFLLIAEGACNSGGLGACSPRKFF